MVLAFIFLNCITIALERPQIEAGSTVSGPRQRVTTLVMAKVGWGGGSPGRTQLSQTLSMERAGRGVGVGDGTGSACLWEWKATRSQKW